MRQELVIEGQLPDLNEYTRANRTSRFSGNTMKQDASDAVMYYAKKQKLKPVYAPCVIEFHWYCRDRKKDKDNVAFAKKFILDGLQSAGVLQQDNWNAIDGFSDKFYLDKDKPRIVVVINY